MTFSRLAALGALISTTALLAGQGAAQPALNPPAGAQLAIQPPRLESILGSNGGCSTNGPVYASAAGYNGTADVFEGPTALVLTGQRLAQLSDIVVVLANGTRLPALTRGECAGGAVRVTFALPTGARAARLELLAPEALPLVAAPKPVQSCIDRITGKPAACPEPPTAAAVPRKVKVADVGLNLIVRPRINSVAPDRIAGAGTGTCRGNVVFSGTGLGAAQLVADTGGLPFAAAITSQTATTINAALTKACSPGTILGTTIQPAAFVRRGAQGGRAQIIRCDTCSDATPATFGGAVVRFAGN